MFNRMILLLLFCAICDRSTAQDDSIVLTLSDIESRNIEKAAEHWSYEVLSRKSDLIVLFAITTNLGSRSKHKYQIRHFIVSRNKSFQSPPLWS